jgi:hypothetical protein
MLPGTAHHSALVPHGTHRYLPPRPRMTSGPSWPVPDTCLPGGRQEMLAVSHADQSWIIASIMSRRPEEMWSHVHAARGSSRTTTLGCSPRRCATAKTVMTRGNCVRLRLAHSSEARRAARSAATCPAENTSCTGSGASTPKKT